MALGILLIMFVSVSVISVLGVLIMFLSKSTKVKKAAFYAMSIWGMVLAVLSATSLPQNYIGEQVTAWSAGVLSVIGLLVHVKAKNKNQRLIAYLLVTVSIIVGILKLFSFV